MRKFLGRFHVPDVAAPWIDAIVTPLEQRVVSDLVIGEDGAFTPHDVALALSCPLNASELSLMSLEGLLPVPEDEVNRFIDNAYRRGVFSYAEDGDRLVLSNFYNRLDIFAIAEQDAWRALPEDAKQGIESWYFDTYYDGLDWSREGGKPTDETILTLEETLVWLDENDAQGRQVYLTDCDCRSLGGACESPTLVCLNYRDGLNSYPDRGLSRPISAREARAVATSADRAGLVHTVNPWGLCNCCDDCCYLFRARERRGSGAIWPESRHIVNIDTGKCIGCGICLGRCRFGVFDESDLSGGGKASVDRLLCVGCGVCVTTCPAGALSLSARSPGNTGSGNDADDAESVA
ncbi:MAG: ferredoxin family protein [Clostridiales Family XIII bacterium]|jgi:NAD-dependent dihydropyrimidine dehydrogenase PreA subunit|nr:ferredoxin family protein [Clostridiales Family XIII bacterium]